MDLSLEISNDVGLQLINTEQSLSAQELSNTQQKEVT